MTLPKSRTRPTPVRLPDDVRLALRRYFPTEVSARSAAYYALPEHLALLRLRSEAESRMLRWNDVAEDLKKDLGNLAIRVNECTAFTNSYEMEVLLHEDTPFPDEDVALFEVIKPPIRTARLAASFLLPYWTIAFQRQRQDRDGNIIIDPAPQSGKHSTRVLNAAKKALRKHGWKKMPPNMAQTKVPDLDLEYVEQGQVRIADIVFGDLHAL